MTQASVAIAVVGHTNTGKTSLLRTLGRDAGFGEVADSPATTRQVQGLRVVVDDDRSVTLFDTPGLEQADSLYDHLSALSDDRHDGPERLRQLLADPRAAARYEQECRVLEQALACDVLLYVIDAREPVLGKYRDELAILAMSARPVLPVLNFVATGGRESEWRETLRRLGLHAAVAFDTVVYDLASEQRLWQRLAMLAEGHAALFEQLMRQRAEAGQWRRAAALQRIADLLIDCAAARQRVLRDDPTLQATAAEQLRRQVRTAEEACAHDLLALFRFQADAYSDSEPELPEGPWRLNPFTPEALAGYGLRTTGAAGAGAAAGAVFDLATGGLSLGAGTALGAALGAGVGGWRSFGGRIRDRAQGMETLHVSDQTVRLLGLRQLHLLDALQCRGHAAPAPVQAGRLVDHPLARGAMPAALVSARRKPGWSRLNAARGVDEDARRQQAQQALADFMD